MPCPIPFSNLTDNLMHDMDCCTLTFFDGDNPDCIFQTFSLLDTTIRKFGDDYQILDGKGSIKLTPAAITALGLDIVALNDEIKTCRKGAAGSGTDPIDVTKFGYDIERYCRTADGAEVNIAFCLEDGVTTITDLSTGNVITQAQLNADYALASEYLKVTTVCWTDDVNGDQSLLVPYTEEKGLRKDGTWETLGLFDNQCDPYTIQGTPVLSEEIGVAARGHANVIILNPGDKWSPTGATSFFLKPEGISSPDGSFQFTNGGTYQNPGTGVITPLVDGLGVEFNWDGLESSTAPIVCAVNKSIYLGWTGIGV